MTCLDVIEEKLDAPRWSKRKLDSKHDRFIFWLSINSSRHDSPEVTLSEDRSASQSNSDKKAALRRGTCIF